MIKFLILLSLIISSLQINNCDYTKKVCKSCTKTGYTVVIPAYGYGEPKCVSQAFLESLQEKFPHCIDGSFEESNSYCSMCERGYLVSRNGTCIERPHCYSIDGKDICIGCGGPYFLYNGECIKKPICEEIDQTSGKCKKCNSYYYPDDKGDCVQIPIEHCKKGNAKACEVCQSYYYLTDDKKCARITLSNCEEGTAKECTECDWLYYLVDGKCQKITEPAHCTWYDEKGNCDECEDNYYLENNECKGYTKVDNCEYYQYDANECGECKSSYYLDSENNKCLPKTIDNCEYQTGENHCERCEDGYELNKEESKCEQFCVTEEICLDCDENYETYDDGKTCTILDTNYVSHEETGTTNGNNFISLNLTLFASSLLLFIL